MTVCVVLMLAGGADDRLQGVERLSETDFNEAEIQASLREEPTVEIAEDPPRRGFLGGLFAGNAAVEPVAETSADVEE